MGEKSWDWLADITSILLRYRNVNLEYTAPPKRSSGGKQENMVLIQRSGAASVVKTVAILQGRQQKQVAHRRYHAFTWYVF